MRGKVSSLTVSDIPAHYAKQHVSTIGPLGYDPRIVARAMIEAGSLAGAAQKLGCTPDYIREHHSNLIKVARRNGVIRTRT